ncbi:MAG: carboxypeptidase regulatory-like domain-containing protein [Deltaproteobacteria bacterium]|nr:carboxypeptidase regulatory-like domain-containing protein [Deltaproteobacteria bacterium]
MRGLVERLTVGLAALVWLLLAAQLTDVAPRRVAAPAPLAARVALAVRVTVDGGVAPEARVRLYVDEGRRVLEAVAREGEARLDDAPSGGAWLVVEAPGRARTSRRVEVGPESEEVLVELAPAEAFELVVVDAAQRPVRNATVFLHGGDPLPHASYTDATGLAAFDALGAAPYAAEIVAPGFGRRVIEDLGADSSPLFVKLDREAELVVHVVDEAGSPAGNASVLVAGSTFWPARRVVADDTGRAAFSGLGRGFYELRAARDKAVSEVHEGVLLEPGETREIELHLVAGTFVEVFVSDGEGEPARPVEGADVALVEGGLSSFPIYGRTGVDGLVRLGPIVGGDATASAQASGFVPRSGVLVEQASARVRIALSRAARLTGRVVDERGYPVDGATLEVVGVAEDGMPIAESALLLGLRDDHLALAAPGPTPLVPRGELGVMPVVPGVPLSSGPSLALGARAPSGLEPWSTRRDGTFELAPVSPGRVQLLARHPRFVDGLSAPVLLRSGERGELELVMRRGGAVEGRVLDRSGRAVAAARIELLSLDGATERITFSADDGTFAFPAVPSEVVLAVARPEEPETIVERLELDVPAEGRRVVDVVLPERRDALQLRVVDARGFPIDRAEVSAASLDPSVALTRTAFADEGGRLELAGARALPLRIVARRRGYAPRVSEVDRAPAELTLTLDPELTLEGEVRSRDGWLDGAVLTLVTAAGDRHAKTSGGGRFRIGELAAGPARLLVTARGYAFDERDVTLEADSRGRVVLPTIELARGGRVEGLVVDERGAAVAGARVALGRVPTYLPAGPLPPGMTLTDDQGRFVLEDLEPGAASIEAFRSGSGRGSVAGVEVRGGDAVRDLRIALATDTSTASSAPGTLAVTLSEHEARRGIALLLEHVPYGGEALRAGLFAGDELLAIDGHPTESLADARARLDGPLSHGMVLDLYRPNVGRYRVRVRREVLRP